MERKEIRELIGYTFANESSNQKSWHNSATSFHEGANVLALHKDSFPGGIRVFLVNAALSLELLFKAIIVAKGKGAPPHHNLQELAGLAEVGFTERQKTTLELLEQIFKWSGRYSVPTKESVWDPYHDTTFEKHVIRERVENVRRVRANPETFPSVENCDELWRIATQRWEEIQSH